MNSTRTSPSRLTLGLLLLGAVLAVPGCGRHTAPAAEAPPDLVLFASGALDGQIDRCG